jgi:hypothetical protein
MIIQEEEERQGNVKREGNNKNKTREEEGLSTKEGKRSHKEALTGTLKLSVTHYKPARHRQHRKQACR